MRALQKSLLLAPVLAFWILAWLGISAGQLSPYHKQCVRLWQDSRWEELNALAENLWKLHRRDSESLALAAISGFRLQQHDRAQSHASRFLRSRALNRACERQLASVYSTANPIDKVRLYRARSALILLAVVALLNLASFVLRRDLLPWSAAFSALGCLILLI